MIRRPNPALALCYAGMVCLAIAVNLMPLFLTTVRVEFGGKTGLTDEQLGMIGAITFAGLVSGILISGPLADRWGGKPFSVLGSSMIGIGLSVLGISQSYPLILAAVFVMGIGAGVLDMVLSPIVAALRPHNRATALNWLHSFYGIGTVITVVIGMLMLRSGIEWHRIALVLVAIPLFVAFGFVNLDLPPLISREEGCRTDLQASLDAIRQFRPLGSGDDETFRRPDSVAKSLAIYLSYALTKEIA